MLAKNALNAWNKGLGRHVIAWDCQVMSGSNVTEPSDPNFRSLRCMVPIMARRPKPEGDLVAEFHRPKWELGLGGPLGI